MTLAPSVLARARRRLQQGLLLREIAAQLGCAFEDVCLALYGDNDWVPRIGPTEAEALDPEGSEVQAGPEFLGNLEPDDSTVAEIATVAPATATSSTAALKEGPGKTKARDALAQIGTVPPVKAAEPQASQEVAFASTGDSIRTRVPEVSSPAGTQALPVETDPTELERQALAVLHSATRFRLRAPDGQVLHTHERGLTRMPSFFWRGTAEQVAALKRKRPEWQDLKPEAITT